MTKIAIETENDVIVIERVDEIEIRTKIKIDQGPEIRFLILIELN